MRFGMQRYQRRPYAGLSEQAFSRLKDSPRMTSQEIPPILQNHDHGFATYRQATDRWIVSSFPEEVKQENRSGCKSFTSSSSSAAAAAAAVPPSYATMDSTVQNMLSSGRPQVREEPLCDPEFCSEMPPVLETAYAELYGTHSSTSSSFSYFSSPMYTSTRNSI
jgi:hypothetical protein